jgi:DNA processing protein
LTDSHTPYWLGFSLVPEIGPKRLGLLLEYFGNLADAWRAAHHELERAGLDSTPRRNLIHLREKLELGQEMRRVEQAGAHVLTLHDEAYPTLLARLPDAPILLYVKGQLQPGDARAVGVVGTRRATVYGRDAAYRLSKELAAHQVTIISGLAPGIDTAAHKGALDAGGRTLAVLGCGIDITYPAENRDLARQISQRGALLTEFPLGMRPGKNNFPRRNRIISGLSLGVLVAEAPEKSGALITASSAADQGRDVFAVPGNIFNPMGLGANRLIQDGAKLVTCAQDMLDELEIVTERQETQAVVSRVVSANPTEARILGYLTAEPIHVDEIVRMSQMPIAVVSSTLTILELKGLARSVGSMQYCLYRV